MQRILFNVYIYSVLKKESSIHIIHLIRVLPSKVSGKVAAVALLLHPTLIWISHL